MLLMREAGAEHPAIRQLVLHMMQDLRQNAPPLRLRALSSYKILASFLNKRQNVQICLLMLVDPDPGVLAAIVGFLGTDAAADVPALQEIVTAVLTGDGAAKAREEVAAARRAAKKRHTARGNAAAGAGTARFGRTVCAKLFGCFGIFFFVYVVSNKN